LYEAPPAGLGGARPPGTHFLVHFEIKIAALLTFIPVLNSFWSRERL